MHRIWVII